MEIGNFTVANNPNRLPRLIEHTKKIYDAFKGDTIKNPKTNDTLAQLLNFKSSNNGSYWSELSALKAYGLLEGRGDLQVSQLGKDITYGDETKKAEAALKALLNIPLWKELHNRHRLELPTTEFWAKLAAITGCEAPVAKSNEQFITEAYKEDASIYSGLMKAVKPSTEQVMDLTPPDKSDQGTGMDSTPQPQFIEVKAGPFYQRLPYNAQGKKVAVDFLNALEITESKVAKTKGDR